MATRDLLSHTGKDGTTSPSFPSISSVAMLDPWAFSLEDAVLEDGIDASIPTLSIISESWLTNPETKQVRQLLRSSATTTTGESGGVASLYAPHSVHASVADSVSWLPGFVLRKMGMRGKQESQHDTIRSVANACVKHMRRQGQTAEDYGDLSPSLAPYPISICDDNNDDSVSTTKTEASN
uniref:1-alkyl-2-acetylglycerophosphocholine esterase n=1 Tax=Grammatophora oceanica TaxID=210454 RepID=A0A7S1VFY3_9STRA|mmetsp:Transcript_44012/g.65278  ORF Transcript_44012/g.65278 Transcript_44012/m.65278 type:complete len:181 (+) Transcript_44012:3-545(+)